ncbi:hypothetical protein, partial [Sphingomonas sp. 10B4]|uniref:hypothetical protein n=1 Tax=Sphingomonas sp. 10B4 TaxID=3048575 RepID=UPI002B224B60
TLHVTSMKTASALIAGLLLPLGACGAARQSENTPAAAAVDVPLPTKHDRDDFILMLRESAAAHGFHVDAATPEEIQQSNSVSPITVNATVWRGKNDDEVVASAMDGIGHVGRVWLSFEKGSDQQTFSAFKADLWRHVRRRWPDALPLPIMPTGAIPLPNDLVRTPDGFKVKPSAAAKYRR